MATVTNAAVCVRVTGQTVRADCFGNNIAAECPACLSYPVLFVAVPNQRGSSQTNPSICRRCGERFYIVDDLNPRELLIVTIARIE